MTAPVTQEVGTATGSPERSEKIAMTAPVEQEASGDEWRIAFMMPAEYTIETLPEPLDSSVKLKEVPGRTVAAIRYSGAWKQDRYEKHLSELRKWIEAHDLRSAGDPVWARYDPPFKPWFLRRNEILIPVKAAPERDKEVPVQSQSDEKAGTQLATFGAGCFWCVEAVFQRLEGVLSVESGYAGGTVEDPTYEQVCSGTTGHAEVCRIRFDPAKISYATLLEVFWKTHNPTTLNRQGYDLGTQYRSVIFYHTEEQRELAEKYKKELDASGAWNRPIVTEIEPAPPFYKAEEYHQNYYNSNPGKGYCARIIAPKLEKFEKVFKDKLKR
jgi:peptide-methionine (S)-S-oxide reductase